MQSKNSSNRGLQTVELDLKALRLDPKNPRRHHVSQVRQIARSIKAFGFNVPLLIDQHGMILAGHGRFLAAQQLGLSCAPVIRLDHLTPAQARAFSIADNRLTENASWDDQLLGEIFLELSELDLEFDLEVTGFTMGEIDLRIDGLDSTQAGNDALDVPIPDSNQVPVTQSGDLWELGHHRILCSSSLEDESFQVLLRGREIGMVFVDPPFNVQIKGHVSGNGKAKHREFAMASGEMSSVEFTQFLTKVMRLLANHSRDGSLHFHCMDWRHLPEILEAGGSVYDELKNICVWVKDKGGMGSLYRSQHEMVLVYKKGKGAHRNNIELGRFGRYRTNVWKYPSASTLSRKGSEGDLLSMHPTVKPMALVADAIRDCTARGDLICDAFLGSGTTLLAAEQTGRFCYGLEIDPLYVDTAIRRWQMMTKKTAKLVSSGDSFNALEEQAISSRVAAGRGELV
jgi:DNA methylase/ParB-like nuclease domain